MSSKNSQRKDRSRLCAKRIRAANRPDKYGDLNRQFWSAMPERIETPNEYLLRQRLWEGDFTND